MKKLWPLWRHRVEIRDEVVKKTSQKCLGVVRITGDYTCRKNLIHCSTTVTLLYERKLVQSHQIHCRIRNQGFVGNAFRVTDCTESLNMCWVVRLSRGLWRHSYGAVNYRSYWLLRVVSLVQLMPQTILWTTAFFYHFDFSHRASVAS